MINEEKFKKYNLSERAMRLLRDTNEIEDYSLCDKNTIERIFIEEGIPIFEKVIEFQLDFAGLAYRIGEDFDMGFNMKIIGENHKGKKSISGIWEKDEKYYFECMEYPYAGDWGNFINQDGKIFGFAMGNIFPIADNIEEYLEDKGILHELALENYKRKNLENYEFEDFKEVQNLSKVKNPHFTNKFFEWWENDEKTILARYETEEKSLGGILRISTMVYMKKCEIKVRTENYQVESSQAEKKDTSKLHKIAMIPKRLFSIGYNILRGDIF
ncbi:MAG: hypothetical protein ACRCWG_03775 [Sarcina sp.]